ncbi:MAG: AAA family ATPase [Candidatus Hydrogenedens sp.]|jgi:hypothetical protein|nr:AAA family ATPase [Candidatus Hydrogenedens sp.]
MNLKEELSELFGAGVSMLNLITYEEDRVIRTIEKLPGQLGIYTWDIADGLSCVRAGQQVFDKDLTADTLLPALSEHLPPATVMILKDFHHTWAARKGLVTRKLRNMAPELRRKNQFLVFITPMLNLPAELKDDVLVLHVPLPNTEELTRLFADQTSGLDRTGLPSQSVRAKLISSALGLTTNQARQAFARVWARFDKFDERGIEMVMWAKREVVRESGALEFWPAEEGEAGVGGLDLLKEWLKKRETAFSEEARLAGLPFPRGVALIGISGTGKSLSARMVSGIWKMPLLRLDIGAVFESLLGESEKHMQKAIMLAETVSPCILWIDEMEKAFAGVGAGSINSGAATRVFGGFLTWMQEHRTPVFVLATANDVEALPAELMGRFDRTFFLDLPNETERRDILKIHLKCAGETFPERKFRFEELIARSRGFVGREIERIVREAQFTAFADGHREIEEEDLLSAIREVVPLSKSHTEIIESLRKWKTEGRAFPASTGEQTVAGTRGRIIETE